MISGGSHNYVQRIRRNISQWWPVFRGHGIGKMRVLEVPAERFQSDFVLRKGISTRAIISSIRKSDKSTCYRMLYKFLTQVHIDHTAVEVSERKSRFSRAARVACRKSERRHLFGPNPAIEISNSVHSFLSTLADKSSKLQ